MCIFNYFSYIFFVREFLEEFLLARAQQWLQSAEISRLINSDRWGEIIGKSDGVLWPICESCEKLFFWFTLPPQRKIKWSIGVDGWIELLMVF